MSAQTKSVGEEAFSQAFQFKPLVPFGDHDELRDYLYKFAHNLDEAKQYLQILRQVNSIEFSQKSELLFRIHGMALQCFALAMRRMTDAIGVRSLQNLIPKAIAEEFREQELTDIRRIYSHYKGFLNKGVAHQDKHSIKQSLLMFPDTKTIEADLGHLQNFYLKLANEICTSYINPATAPHDYSSELEKLISGAE